LSDTLGFLEELLSMSLTNFIVKEGFIGHI